MSDDERARLPIGASQPHQTALKVDLEAAHAARARMWNIVSSIGEHASKPSLRCPYKDAKARCTAKFECRNQRLPKLPHGALICTARDGDLNWRSAWQTG